MTTRIIGQTGAVSPADHATINLNQQLFWVTNYQPDTLIVYRLHGWFGRINGSPRVRLGIGATSGTNPDPAARLGYTGEIIPDANMFDANGGAAQSAALLTPVLIRPGFVALGVASAGGDLGARMKQSAYLPNGTKNRRFYRRAVGGNVPSDPIGGSASIEGHLSVWAEGMLNEPPALPTNIAPSGNLISTATTPAMASDFSDPNETLPNGVAWDRISQVHIQVQRVSDGALLWDHSYIPTSAEQTSGRPSVTYAGQALSVATDYRQQVRHQDRAGAWSDWSAWVVFAINSGGTVSQPSAPVGKQETITPGPFVAVWSHAAGLSTNAVEVQLWRGSTLIDTSPEIAQSVAPGGTISVTWAETAFAALSWGTAYRATISGRDTDGAWSPSSSPVDFATNARPSVPVALSPANNAPLSAYPVLSCRASDADDTPATGLTVIAQIFNDETGALIANRTMTLVTGTDRWTYQTTSADLPAYGNYRWHAYSADGTLASLTTSFPAAFVYAEGPNVVITSPSSGFAYPTSTPRIAWTVEDQLQRNVRIYAADGMTLIYEPSGFTYSTATELTIPASVLRNETDYQVEVIVTNSAGLTGSSQRIPFRIDFPPPPTLQGLLAEARRLPTDRTETVVLVLWEPTTYPHSRFRSYDLFRVPLSEDGSGVPVGMRKLLRRITNPLQTAWLDAEPVSGVVYRYEVEQVILQDLDQITSLPATATAMVHIEGVVLSSVIDPERHVHLPFWPERGGRRRRLRHDRRQLAPAGSRTGRSLRGSLRAFDPSGSFPIRNDPATGLTAAGTYQAVLALVESGDTLCYRDGRQRLTYVSIADYDDEDAWPNGYEVSLGFVEEAWTPGEPVGGTP